MTRRPITTMLVAAWVAVLVSASGCVSQPTEKPVDMAAILSELDASVVAATKTLSDAVALGTISTSSKTYRDAYQAIVSADAALTMAENAYATGDVLGSRSHASDVYAAMSVYQSIRPALVKGLEQ